MADYPWRCTRWFSQHLQTDSVFPVELSCHHVVARENAGIQHSTRIELISEMLPCLFLNCPCRVQTNDVHIPAPFWARKESGPVSRKLSYGLQFFVFSFGSKHHYDFDWSTRMFCPRTTLASFCIAKPPTVQLCSINTTNRWPALYQTHHRPPVRTSVQLLTSTSCTVCQSYPRWRARGTRSGYPHHNQSS